MIRIRSRSASPPPSPTPRRSHHAVAGVGGRLSSAAPNSIILPSKKNSRRARTAKALRSSANSTSASDEDTPGIPMDASALSTVPKSEKKSCRSSASALAASPCTETTRGLDRARRPAATEANDGDASSGAERRPRSSPDDDRTLSLPKARGAPGTPVRRRRVPSTTFSTTFGTGSIPPRARRARRRRRRRLRPRRRGLRPLHTNAATPVDTRHRSPTTRAPRRRERREPPRAFAAMAPVGNQTDARSRRVHDASKSLAAVRDERRQVREAHLVRSHRQSGRRRATSRGSSRTSPNPSPTPTCPSACARETRRLATSTPSTESSRANVRPRRIGPRERLRARRSRSPSSALRPRPRRERRRGAGDILDAFGMNGCRDRRRRTAVWVVARRRRRRRTRRVSVVKSVGDVERHGIREGDGAERFDRRRGLGARERDESESPRRARQRITNHVRLFHGAPPAEEPSEGVVRHASRETADEHPSLRVPSAGRTRRRRRARRPSRGTETDAHSRRPPAAHVRRKHRRVCGPRHERQRHDVPRVVILGQRRVERCVVLQLSSIASSISRGGGAEGGARGRGRRGRRVRLARATTRTSLEMADSRREARRRARAERRRVAVSTRAAETIVWTPRVRWDCSRSSREVWVFAAPYTALETWMECSPRVIVSIARSADACASVA